MKTTNKPPELNQEADSSIDAKAIVDDMMAVAGRGRGKFRHVEPVAQNRSE